MDDFLDGFHTRGDARVNHDGGDDHGGQVFNAAVTERVLFVGQFSRELVADDCNDGRECIREVVHGIENDGNGVCHKADNRLDARENDVGDNSDNASSDDDLISVDFFVDVIVECLHFRHMLLPTNFLSQRRKAPTSKRSDPKAAKAAASHLFNAPVDGFEPLADKIVISLAKVLAAEESAVCRERTRVRSGENQVAAIGRDEHLLFNGKTAPEQKDEVLANLRKTLDNRVRELLPANACVACRHVGAHRERCVQKQNSLVRPAFQVSVGRWRDAEVVVEFLENVDEGWRRLNAKWHREAKPVSLARIVVRVLSDDDCFDFIDGAIVEGCKNLRSGRVHHVMFRVFLQKFCLDLLKIRLFELVGEQF